MKAYRRTRWHMASRHPVFTFLSMSPSPDSRSQINPCLCINVKPNWTEQLIGTFLKLKWSGWICDEPWCDLSMRPSVWRIPSAVTETFHLGSSAGQFIKTLIESQERPHANSHSTIWPPFRNEFGSWGRIYLHLCVRSIGSVRYNRLIGPAWLFFTCNQWQHITLYRILHEKLVWSESCVYQWETSTRIVAFADQNICTVVLNIQYPHFHNQHWRHDLSVRFDVFYR